MKTSKANSSKHLRCKSYAAVIAYGGAERTQSLQPISKNINTHQKKEPNTDSRIKGYTILVKDINSNSYCSVVPAPCLWKTLVFATGYKTATSIG